MADFSNLDTHSRRSLLRLFDRCHKLVVGSEEIEKRHIFPYLSDIYSAESAPPSGEFFFEALQALITFLVASSEKNKIERIGRLTRIICEAVTLRFGSDLYGWPIKLESISQIRQTYWNAVAARTRSKSPIANIRRVIRINDIPFAEAVFPALLSRDSHGGNLVVIEDVPWSQVGDALMNWRIDVALYPGEIEKQISLVNQPHTRGRVYKSNPLVIYNGYPIIRNTGIVKNPGKFMYPRGSDFQTIIDENISKSGRFKFEEPVRERSHEFHKRELMTADSADRVLAEVVNGEVEFGLVGALQAHYAETQFGNLKNNGGEYGVVEIGQLRKKEPNPCHFWVASQSEAEAKSILDSMVNQWNALLVQGWPKISDSSSDLIGQSSRQLELLAMVNSQSHLSFIERFSDLQILIAKHDSEHTELVPKGCTAVKIH